ncbi:otoferlin [Chelonus insularis]|uniref:otoferlin n=1 Tax=Chelonus insularis TaxID=460826 RepID=UPI00158872E7|nr:otoferlin [Chelonus insularis]
MHCGRKKGKSGVYQIAITIIEAKYLAQNANPMVVVKVGNQKRKTVIRNRTDSPYFNEYFVFSFTGDIQVFLSTRISISVYLKRYLRLQFHGGISFDVATVWDQPNREYYHKWAMLTNPKDPTGTPKGYVKCNIAINVKGEKMPIHAESEGEEDIEGNLLMPIANFFPMGRQKARYIFSVYRADGLSSNNFNCSYGEFDKTVNPFIQISFAGLKGETRWHTRTHTACFYEKIIFTEMFPPLSYRVRIAIKHKVDSCRSTVLATNILSLAKLSNSGEYGFLPTYGPSFIHFYNGDSVDSRSHCASKCQVMRPIYQGRVLLSLKTEIDDSGSPIISGVDTEPIAPIIERKLWSTEEYLLVGIIYDASMIDRSRFMKKSISFEINIGNAGSHIFPHNVETYDHVLHNVIVEKRPDFESSSTPRLMTTTDGKFNYLPIGSNKPCLYVKSWWPNLQWRVSNSNILMYIHNFLEDKLSKLEMLIAVGNPTVYETYNDIIESLKGYCMQYLQILDTETFYESGGTTKLDRHRVNLCRNSIQDIVKMIDINGKLQNNNYVKIAMLHAYKYLRKIYEISEDPQHSFPDIFIWMVSDNKHVALARLPASKIIYSEQSMSCGPQCGQRVNLFMNNIDEHSGVVDYSACNIEIFLWFGNIKFSSACWDVIPEGYDANQFINSETFPRTLNYVVTRKFQLRAHIFQGRFDSGLDPSGLMDPFIRVMFHGYTATTRSIKQSLAPVWDETLVFPSIKLYGMKESIKSMPPRVVIEAFDWDLCGAQEFFGRCVAVPVVNFQDEPYSPPDFPPTLTWYNLLTELDFQGSVLAAFELIQVTEADEESSTDIKIYNLPDDIRPTMRSHRLEVIFWGVRDLRKLYFNKVTRPQIIIECSGVHVKSEIMKNAKKFPNFHHSHVVIELDLPEQDIYYPPITIQVFDFRKFGCLKYAGVCIVPTAHIFLEELITEAEYNYLIYGEEVGETFQRKSESELILPLPIDYDPEEEEKKSLISYEKVPKVDRPSRMMKILDVTRKFLFDSRDQEKNEEENYGNDEDESYDWWSKYFASLEEEKNRELGEKKVIAPGQKPIATFKIYSSELEMQPEFEGFQDKLTTFELSRGKETGDSEQDEKNYAGKFKGHISIYPWPHPDNLGCKTKNGWSVSSGFLADYPHQEPVKLIVRLYVVKGINLHPCDPLTGKSDPYLKIKLGKTTINDQKNYIPNQLNPVFGKCFEIEAEFPKDHTLIIQVWDWDAASVDDLIGETQIDIENRYYSDHRGHCGISRTYSTSGYNAWRDREKPMQILESLCRKNKLPMPEFSHLNATIGKQKFTFSTSLDLVGESGNVRNGLSRQECMALHILHHWQQFPICGVALVPEHLERRSLFNAKKPGLEQGKLELWVDMFRIDDLPPKPPINISPQIPEEYELRVIIWNTEDVPLSDNQFLTGEKCSDIYVKGWLLYEDLQKTDIHYNSLTGEGNFNWRFVFRFTYSKSEHLMIVKKKLSVFARDATEQKLPCKFYLQVWDSDHFSPDDFLGFLTLDLSRMPRGSTNSKNCTLKIMDPASPTISLFNVRRTKAWWPFMYSTNGEYIQAGKVEMEMTLVPISEADEKPVGKGRDPPNPLAPPDRPDTSFSWFRNPWKAFCFVVCRYYKWRLVCCCSIFLLILLFGCALYAFPGYLVKRILGA